MELPASLAFDCPTAAAVAEHVMSTLRAGRALKPPTAVCYVSSYQDCDPCHACISLQVCHHASLMRQLQAQQLMVTGHCSKMPRKQRHQ